MGVIVVSDSTADLPPELIAAYGIYMVPLKVHFAQEEYRDGVDITADEFYQKLRVSKALPTTSQPSPGEFESVYRQVLAGGNHSIISIHISAQLSGTHHSAVIAASMLPEADIEVVDSEVASTIHGLIVIQAARAAQAGKSKAEILRLIQELKKKVTAFFMVDTLEYLVKGGRIGKAQAILGTMLNIKPILTIEDGVIAPVAKARGRVKGMEEILHRLEAEIGSQQQSIMVIMHADNREGMEKLKAKVQERWQPQELLISDVGPVIGTHVGPGTLCLIGVKP